MTNEAERTTKRLIEYLPAIYREGASRQDFLSQFLQAFDVLLFDEAPEGNAVGLSVESLEKKIARLHLIFNPQHTPEDFLPWLAGWAALSFGEEFNAPKRRKLLSQIVPLYRIRGTRKYLEDLLTICLDTTCSVSDAESPALQVGTYSTIGADTRIGGGPPHFFQVRLVASKLSPLEVKQQANLAVTIIELAKPAHTFYDLEIVSPSMQLGKYSTVGLDTVLGPASSE